MLSKANQAFRLRAFLGAVLLFSVLGAFGVYRRHSFIETIEARTWDWRMQWTAESPKETPVRIITIDQASLDYLAQKEALVWPFQRGVYPALLGYLKRAGARAVAFDILFTEPSSYGVADDDELASGFAESPPVVSAITLRREQSEESPEDLALFAQRLAELNLKGTQPALPVSAMGKFEGVTLPVPQLLRASHGFGDVQGDPDPDGVFRHAQVAGMLPAAENREAASILKLPFALLNLAYPGRKVDFTPFLDRDGKLAVRFYGPQRTIPTDSFANIYTSWQNILADSPPLIPLERYKDTLVLIGMDAPGLLDLRPTPIDPHFPGVEINATLLQNALDESFIRSPPAWVSALLTVALVVAIAAGTLFLSGFAQAFAIFILAAGLLGGCFGAALLGWWMPMVVPSAALLGTLTSCLGLQYLIEGRQHRFIRGAFRFYVSPSVIDRIVKDPSHLQLGGEKRELTIFFSDIAGFTTISESLEASRLVPLLNAYLTCLTDVIMSHGGTVDKYVGDAVVAFWNAPLAQTDHARRGVAAAIEIQQKLAQLAPEFEREYGVKMKTRIGLNSGAASVGNFGSRSRFNYTVIGDAANLASRLEGANKFFGTSILIANRTFELIEGTVPVRKVGSILVVGKTQGISVYEPLMESHPLRNPDLLNVYHQALLKFENRDFEGARDLFARFPEDSVAKLYLARLVREASKAADQWSSVWTLSEK